MVVGRVYHPETAVAFFGFLSTRCSLAFFRLVAFLAFGSLLFLAFDVALSAAFFRLVALSAFFRLFALLAFDRCSLGFLLFRF